MPAAPAWLHSYYERGFRLIFYAPGQKGPSGPEAVKWTDRSDTEAEYQKWLDRGIEPNVGVFLGHEISTGRFLADIDFDWPEGLQLSRRLLPKTGFGFGRTTRQISHAFYVTPTPVQSRIYEGIDGKHLFELRGTTTKGTVGLQTMLPPSKHPSGELLAMRSDDEIGFSDRIELDATLFAIGCLLYQHLGHRGLLHDVRLAVAGFLLTSGLEEEDVLRLCEALAEVSGNNVSDASLVVKSTAARIKAHEQVLGRAALTKAIGEDGKKVVARIKEWLGGEDFIMTKDGKIIADNEENIIRALDKLDVSLSYDLFNHKPMVKYNGFNGVLADPKLKRMWLDIPKFYRFKPTMEFFCTVVESIGYQSEFHPVKDYLSSLKWDGIPRVDEWLIKYGGAGDSDYTRAVSALVLIAACRRVRQPGCKFDELMVLESDQGMLKSSALRTLCKEENWFGDDLPLNVDAKQIIERTAGKWIIEASELKGMSSNREVEGLKAMLSRQVDGPVRMAYARMPIEQQRQFIIIGTTNSHTYLQDDTGARRFWPVRITRFDIAGLLSDRDQIWAEAAVREEHGESIRLSPDLYSQAAKQQERRTSQDPIEVAIEQKLSSFFDDLEGEEHRDYWNKDHELKLSNWKAQSLVFTDLTKVDPRTTSRFVSAMQKQGFRYTSVREKDHGGRVEKGWKREGKKDNSLKK